MNKAALITAIIVLVAILVLGILEYELLKKEYAALSESLQVIIDKTLAETVKPQDMEDMQQQWLTLREHSELCLPHLDVYELNLRICEAEASVKCGDLDQAYNQLEIALMLTKYIPHLMKPSFAHIF